MRTFSFILLGLFSGIGLLSVAVFVGLIYMASNLDGMRRPVSAVPDKIVLTLDLDKNLVEGPGGPRLEGFNLRAATTLPDAVVAIRKAKDDPRVVAIKATLSNPSLGLAQSQEIRDVVAEFRAAGKPALLFSETMGEGEGALPTYYLAAAFGDIWVQPSATVGIAGIGTEGFFLKTFLARFGVKGSFVARGEYKSAPETFTNTGMSEANREETRALLGSWFEQMVAGIAADRKISADAVRAVIDEGPQLATEALDRKLVDHLGYRDEFDEALKKQLPGAEEMNLDRYVSLPVPGAAAARRRVAVIHAVGEIDRRGEDSPFSGELGIHADSMAKTVRRAADDGKINAILLRIDSPGGSYAASDTIWREIVRAKAKGKPVIVSMGDTAASGGYFIAMPADRIFASPATVTGSIGVFTGKMVVGDALAKLDINRERITFGDSAGMFSATTDFSPKDIERLNRMLDATYADFTGKAAQGRNKTVAEIDKVARGRVWSGADAVGAGLVDELGGFLKALDYTKTRIGLQPQDRLRLVKFSDEKEGWWDIFKYFGANDAPEDVESFFRAAAWFAKVVAPLMEQFESAAARGPQLLMAPVVAK
ncbi:MAG: signal peptide peptidase SppA [Rhodospirillaceae bacterium]|nr:signal peptide peptidase SppA [Rhodospirillaceae bacterium]